MNPLTKPEKNRTTGLNDLLMELAIGFVNVPPDGIDQAIDRSLRMTGEFTGVDRSYLFQYDFEEETTTNTHEWCAEGIQPMIGELQDVPICGIPEWLEHHLVGRTVHIPSVDELPVGSDLREILEPQRIKSLVAVPLVFGAECIGFVGFDSVRDHKKWTDAELKLLRMLAELFTNAVIGRRRQLALEQARVEAESSERRLRRAIEAGLTAIWELGLGSRRVHCVAGWRQLLGKELDGNYLGMRGMARIFDRRDFRSLVREFRRCVCELMPGFESTLRVRHADGFSRQIQIRGCLEYDSRGAVVMASGSATDVSAAVREKQEIRLWLEMEQGLAGISARFVDTDGFDSAVESALADIGTLCGACRAKLFLFDDRLQVMSSAHDWCAPGIAPQQRSSGVIPVMSGAESLCQLLAGEVLQIPDVPALAADHPHRELLLGQGVCSLVSVPLLEGGCLKGLIVLENTREPHRWSVPEIGAVRSCAEIVAGALARNRSQKEIQASEHLYRTILSNLREAVFMTAPSGRITFVNRSWEQVTGIRSDLALGSLLQDLIAPTGQDGGRIGTFPRLNGSLIPDELVKLSGNGGDRWISMVRVPLVPADGESGGTIGTIADVTERLHWEEQLVLDKIRAESASEAKTAYLSSLSHELRTPMHGVLGMLELMLRSPSLDARLASHAVAAHSSAKALVRLLDDILDVARSERGLLSLNEASINPQAVVREVVDILGQQAAAKNVAIELEIPDHVPAEIVGDAFRIRQIATNLIDNAVKFSPGGTVKVSLTPVERAAPGASGEPAAYLRIEVSDSGIGIEPDEIPHIFKPFCRVAKAGQGTPGGSGLGLAIVRDIVNLMNGEIDLRSRPGIGTTVRVDLPIKPGGRQPSAPQVNGATAPEARFTGLRVLVAEDNEINCEVARAHLEQLGCEVAVARHGGEAVEACRNGVFDVVLMDCLMPVLDGFDATREILAKPGPAGRQPLVFGCTANCNGKVERMCLDAGMSAVIGKPYALEDLAALLSSAGSQTRTPESGETGWVDLDLVPVLDGSVLRELAGHAGGTALIVERLLPLFKDNSQRLACAMAEALESGDMPSLERSAHSLKGSAASLGACRLARLGEKLMHGSSGEDACPLDEIRILLDRVGVVRQQTLEALERFQATDLHQP